METCTWHLIEDNLDIDYYETECMNEFCFMEGNVVDNEFHFCPYCGKRILVQP